MIEENIVKRIPTEDNAKMNIPGWHSIQEFLLTSIRGVDHTLAGNGGVDCYDFLTFKQRLLDTCVFTLLAGLFIAPRVLRNLSLPKEWEIMSMCQKRTAQRIVGFRKFLLIILSVILGIEIGYKIASESWIYLLNPCHVITAIQLYLLSAEPSRRCTAIFRVHIHLLFGCFLAFVFPILNTREKPGEQMIYWLQHFLITFVVPPYLIHTGGAYRCEPLKDYSWVLLTIPLFGFYMYYVLQSIGMLTLVNLNNMLCPAISDPFYGPNYRWFAMVHQQLLILLFGKVYTFLVYAGLKLKDIRKPKDKPEKETKFYVETFLDENKKYKPCCRKLL